MSFFNPFTLINKGINSLAPDYGDASADIKKNQSYFQPYYDTGTDALKKFHETSDQLVSDPTKLENSIMSGYSMSPWAQHQTHEMTSQMNRQAAAAGDLGTPNEQAALGRQVQSISSQDEGQFLNNAMQPYHWGLEGLNNMASMGQQAGGSMANIGMSQEQLDKASADYGPQIYGAIFGGAATGAGYAAGRKFE